MIGFIYKLPSGNGVATLRTLGGSFIHCRRVDLEAIPKASDRMRGSVVRFDVIADPWRRAVNLRPANVVTTAGGAKR